MQPKASHSHKPMRPPTHSTPTPNGTQKESTTYVGSYANNQVNLFTNSCTHV